MGVGRDSWEFIAFSSKCNSWNPFESQGNKTSVSLYCRSSQGTAGGGANNSMSNHSRLKSESDYKASLSRAVWKFQTFSSWTLGYVLLCWPLQMPLQVSYNLLCYDAQGVLLEKQVWVLFYYYENPTFCTLCTFFLGLLRSEAIKYKFKVFRNIAGMSLCRQMYKTIHRQPTARFS